MKHKLNIYIDKVEDEIEELIGEELENGKPTFDNEQQIHLLFENRKHAKEWLCELDDTHHAASSSAVR